MKAFKLNGKKFDTKFYTNLIERKGFEKALSMLQKQSGSDEATSADALQAATGIRLAADAAAKIYEANIQQINEDLASDEFAKKDVRYMAKKSLELN